MYVCVRENVHVLWECVHLSIVACRFQKRVLYPLELPF